MDINSKEALVVHGERIKQKKILYNLYLDFYKYLKKTKHPKGKVVEIGSGGGFMKEVFPDVVTSDVIKGPDIDLVFSATNMPFKKGSISAFLLFDVFHHIKDPEKALQEMYRCLKKGGKIVMIEPFVSPLSFIIFRFLHPEKTGFNTRGNWYVSGTGRMSDANPAIPWIIFIRDKDLFNKKFPGYRINKIFSHTPFKYLISGGLSKYQLLPTGFCGIIDKIEKKVSHFNKYISMFMTIEIEKV